MSLVALRIGSHDHRAELRCGRNDHPHGVVQRGFRTAQLACCWVLHGTGTIAVQGRVVPFGPGDVFQRLPGVVHQVEMPGPAAWMFVGVPGAFHQALVRVAPATAMQPVLHPGADAPLLRRWIETTRRLRACPQSTLVTAAAELFGLIAELHRRAAAPADVWTGDACRLLDDADDRPLPDIARRMGLSPSAFRARFVAAVGEPPRSYRIRRRIARAQELLADPGIPLAAVAEKLGYPDLPTFAKRFRAVVGTPPGAWRRSLG